MENVVESTESTVLDALLSVEIELSLIETLLDDCTCASRENVHIIRILVGRTSEIEGAEAGLEQRCRVDQVEGFVIRSCSLCSHPRNNCILLLVCIAQKISVSKNNHPGR